MIKMIRITEEGLLYNLIIDARMWIHVNRSYTVETSAPSGSYSLVHDSFGDKSKLCLTSNER